MLRITRVSSGHEPLHQPTGSTNGLVAAGLEAVENVGIPRTHKICDIKNSFG